MIEAVGFDYFGVLTQRTPADFFRDIAQITGLTIDTLRSTYGSVVRGHEKGVPQDVVWRVIADATGVGDSFDQIMAYITTQQPPGINRQMIALLDSLRAQGIRVGILSNVTPEWAQALKDDRIDRHADVTLFSNEVGVEKPDPRAFELLASRLGVTPNAMVFVDDTARYLSRLPEIGMRGILFQSYEYLVKDLDDLGVETGSRLQIS